MCHTKNPLVKSDSLATLNPTWAHFAITESYYVLLQEYPSTSTSCHSVYTPYAYSAITLIHSVNVYTDTRFRFGEELHVSKSICTHRY
jgi:hypothetical protein